MLSTSVGRVVRSTCTACSHASLLTARSTSTCLAAVASRPLSQKAHQRRQSSSKASIPPDGSRRSAPSTQQTSSSSGRVGKRKTKEAAAVPVDNRNQSFSKQYPNLPRVDSTQHLHQSDINVSSFFSLHRPISITHPVPPTSSHSSFSQIFETRVQANKHPHVDVIFTLGSVVDSLEQVSSGGEDSNNLQWHVLQASESNNANGKPLEGTPLNIPTDKIIAQFQPFRPPPPPQPFYDHSTAEQVKPKKKNMERKVRRTKGPKSWSTTIIVTEYTNPDDGSNTYSVSSTPITRLSDPRSMEIGEPGIGTQAPMEQTFLQRMWVRGQKLEDFRLRRREESGAREIKQRSMVLISVKRQRKLKMKKHKYKKLMRRTRNLRRRLGKI